MSNVKTPGGMLSFPNLFKPRASVPGAEPRYSVNILFDAAAQKTPEFKALKQAIEDAIAAEWGAKANDPAFRRKLRNPIRDASEKDYAGYDEGMVYISAWSKTKPGVINGRLQDMVESDVWAGQMARVSVRPFAYSQSGNTGVSLGLQNVQIIKADMPRLDGRRKAQDDFDAVEDEEDAFA